MSEIKTTVIELERDLPEGDPGDEVLRRFRYQISYSGVLVILMADSSQEIEEVFCEFHEDILVKHLNGKYTGVQVKTKDINLPPFNIEDEAIIRSFTKFALLESNFSNQFINYSIVSNTGFDKSKTAVCISSMIEKAKNGEDLLKKGTKTAIFTKSIVSESGCTNEAIIAAIKKTRLKTYCGLDDIHFKLVNAIKSCPLLRGISESKTQEIADLIVAKQFKAASLNKPSNIVDSYILGKTDEAEEIKNVIRGKRITRNEVEEYLTSLKEQPVRIFLKDRQKISNIPKEYKKLEIKMDAGGIDSENIDLMKNFKYSFENHAISWLYKDGAEIAEEKYNQITYIIQNLCKEVYDESGTGETDDGKSMLITIRNKMKARLEQDGKLFFDCTYEHLLGTVGVLTESCKVWWSKKFSMTEE